MNLDKEAVSLARSLLFRANVAAVVFAVLLTAFRGWVFDLVLVNWLLWNALAMAIAGSLLWKARKRPPSDIEPGAQHVLSGSASDSD
ncbi:MAG: hypothetical protein EOP84_05030 [Verrucomicrobiaceae bacterium]|nr:MAG: hypothetical protein EOP84_05030 [Verrucomicrobiaceae bacterium]